MSLMHHCVMEKQYSWFQHNNRNIMKAIIYN